MAYQINKNFASNTNYSLSGDKKAIFNTTNNDIIKSPVPGTTEVSKIEADSITLKDGEGNKFLVSNVTPLQGISNGTRIGGSETIGHAKGPITLEIEGSGFFSGKQKVEDFLMFKSETEKTSNKKTVSSETEPEDLKPEEELWRTPLETYYGPLGIATDALKQGIQYGTQGLFNALKGKTQSNEDEMIDESLLEDIKRIKQLLK